MASKTYEIILLVDHSQAVAATAAAAAGMAAYRAAATSAAQAATRAFNSTAAAVSRATAAVNAHTAATGQAAAAQAALTNSAAGAAAATQAAAVAARAAARAAQALAAAMAATATAGAGANAVIAMNTVQQQQNLAVTAILRDHWRQLGAAGRAIGFGGTAAAGGLGAMGGRIAQMTALLAVTRGVSDAIKAIGDNAFKAAQGVGAVEGDLRELATMKGVPGQTDVVLRQINAQRRATGQSEAEAVASQVKFYESAQSAIGRKISATEAESLMTQIGKYQGTFGGDAGAMSELVAQIVNQAKGPVTGEQAFGQFLQIQRTFQETRGNVKSLNQQYSEQSALYDNTLYTPQTGAGILSMFSMKSPTKAGERLEQLARGTVGGLHKGRRYGYEGSIPQGQYLGGLGVTDQMDVLGIATRISEDFQRREAEAAQKGQKFNVYNYLRQKGYGNIHDIQALMEFHQGRVGGTLGKFMGDVTAPPATAAVEATIKQGMATSAYSAQQRAEAAAALGQQARGGGATSAYEASRKEAYERVRTDATRSAWFRGVMPDYEQFDAMGGWGGTAMNLAGGFATMATAGKVQLPSGLNIAAAVDAEQMREENVRRAGVGLPMRDFRAESLKRGIPVERVYAESAGEIAKQGGNLTPNIQPIVDGSDRVVKEVAGLRADLRQGMVKNLGPQAPAFLRNPLRALNPFGGG